MEVLLSRAGDTARRQLAEVRGGKRERWDALRPAVAPGPGFLVEESSRLDSFFDEMDCATRSNSKKRCLEQEEEEARKRLKWNVSVVVEQCHRS